MIENDKLTTAGVLRNICWQEEEKHILVSSLSTLIISVKQWCLYSYSLSRINQLVS